ncbi:hypothetical protein [Acanthopleuribacter pedis]|uniref:Uncharacterized protein n=1 Tax=Acanthopleuribacter pedis TaxID=442870 RepID=A0A8J7QH68_9BACT|nr:hypothetical protein [Acanthopleuribacter pedis]MBO1320105.1 hypothetical protein [Acanthopleuribacter pedis]
MVDSRSMEPHQNPADDASLSADQQAVEIPEDPDFDQAFKGLPEIKVPQSFLPSVMFQVYEKHAREKIVLWQVALIAVLLLAGAGAFLSLDVLAHMEVGGHLSFGQAFSDKVDTVLQSFDQVIAAFGTLVSISWSLAKGAGGHLVKETHPLVLVGGVAVLVGLFVAVRRFLDR